MKAKPTIPRPKIQSATVDITGTITVVNEHGDKETQLQMNLINLWAELAVLLGYQVQDLMVETPDGKWQVRKTPKGYNIYKVEGKPLWQVFAEEEAKGAPGSLKSV